MAINIFQSDAMQKAMKDAGMVAPDWRDGAKVPGWKDEEPGAKKDASGVSANTMTQIARGVTDNSGGGTNVKTTGTTNTTSTNTTGTNVSDTDSIADEDGVIQYLEQAAKQYKPLTDAELETQRKRRKAQGIVSGIGEAIQSLSNLYFTSQYSPNAYDPKQGLSAKAMERWDKADAERAGKDRTFLQLALAANKLKGQKLDREAAKKQAEQQQANFDLQVELKREEAAREQKNLDRAYYYKEGQDKIANQQNQDALEAKKKMHEDDVMLKRQSNSIEYQKVNMAKEKENYVFTLGDNYGSVSLPASHINSQTLGYIWNTLPEAERSKVGKAHTSIDPLTQKPKTWRDEPTEAEKWLAIGQWVQEDSGDNQTRRNQRNKTRQALKNLQLTSPSGKSTSQQKIKVDY